MDLNIQKYQAFLKIVESGSFTKAAVTLNYTQSGISRMIHSLEKDWNIALFEREKSSITLTQEGQSILPYIKSICHDYSELQNQLSTLTSLQSGSLHIGMAVGISPLWITETIKNFCHDFPNIQFEIIKMDSSILSEQLKSGKIECAFLENSSDSDIEKVFLKSDTFTAVIPRHHPLNARSHVSLSDLAPYPFIMPVCLKETIIEKFHHKDQIPNVKFSVPGEQEALAMVEEGLGITILPDSIKNPSDKILNIPIFPQTGRELYAAIRKNKPFSGPAAHFYSYIKEQNYGGYLQSHIFVHQKFKGPPRRVAASSEATIDNLLYLGLSDKIVGIWHLTGASHAPYESEYLKLHKVKSKFNYPTKEQVLKLRPDIIIGWGSLFNKETLGPVENWHEQGINTYIMKNTAPFPAVTKRQVRYFLDDLENLSHIFNIEKQASFKIQILRDKLNRFEKNISDIDEDKKPEICTIQYVSEGDFFERKAEDMTGDIIRLSGGKSIDYASGTPSWIPLRELSHLNPDMILIIDFKGSTAESVINKLIFNPYLQKVPAIREKRFLTIPHNAFYCGSFRTLDAIEKFQSIILGK